MSDNTPKRPTRLDIVDMPRDKARVLGGLRQAICASFNYCRKYPAKLEVLRETLEYVLGRIDTFKAEYEEQQEKVSKQKLEQEGKDLGIDLDSRKTVENMTADLEAHKAKLAAEKPKAEQTPEPNPKAPEKAPTATESTTESVAGAKFLTSLKRKFNKG